MEESRPQKCVCGQSATLRASHEQTMEPHRPGEEAEGMVEANHTTGPRAKPIAYVRPLRHEVRVPTLPDQVEERRSHRRTRRSLRGPRSRSHGQRRRAERSRRRWIVSREQAVPTELDLQVELEDSEPELDPDHESSLSLFSPFIAGLSPPLGQIMGAPATSGYWAVLGQQTSTIYPFISFSPMTGMVLNFMPTSFGTYMVRVPDFFTHIAH